MSVSSLTSVLYALTATLQRSLTFGALALLPLVAAQAAEPLPIPAGPTILTVSGNVAVTNGPEGASFDRQMLSGLGETRILTTTPWTDGVIEFNGVLARTVLDRVGAEGASVHATALNEYTVEIPVSDFTDHDVLLAYEMDGQEMQVSDKGPIWIIYPQDQQPALRNPLLHERWVWQLKALNVQ